MPLLLIPAEDDGGGGGNPAPVVAESSFGALQFCSKCRKLEVVDKYSPKCHGGPRRSR